MLGWTKRARVERNPGMGKKERIIEDEKRGKKSRGRLRARKRETETCVMSESDTMDLAHDERYLPDLRNHFSIAKSQAVYSGWTISDDCCVP
ncbi:hypothetical protein DMN91_000164 [Ooceraea biroi]|uniref:Uncharacterized protein n=1 Tax=Ooceraea biroi TaxID=2015173 RepID=A0A3L8E0X3_OOCBI|nr:hypothetical protein DMN91_000164 [Ooceraea biroi]